MYVCIYIYIYTYNRLELPAPPRRPPAHDAGGHRQRRLRPDIKAMIAVVPI